MAQLHGPALQAAASMAHLNYYHIVGNFGRSNFCINGHKAFRINFRILIFICARARIIPHHLASTRVNNVVVFGGVNGEGVPCLQRDLGCCSWTGISGSTISLWL